MQRHGSHAPISLEPARELPIGAHIVTPRSVYTHHGIYVGEGRVVQYAGLSYGLRGGPVEEISLAQFARGRGIWVRSEGSSSFDREEVVRRARSRLGENRYHPLKNNCEHFCEWCVCGVPRSFQVDRWSCLASGLRRITALFDVRVGLAVRVRQAADVRTGRK
jgi:Lecithin retinol acyltransferase